MRCRKTLCLVICSVFFLSSAVFANQIMSVQMISLANSSKPWTITVASTGQVEWKQSSSGHLMDSMFGDDSHSPRITITREQSAVNALFEMITAAGYTQVIEQDQEPIVKLVVTYTDGKKVQNNGPSPFNSDEVLKTFRDIEKAFAQAAGYDFEKGENEDNELETNTVLYYNSNYNAL